MNIELDSAVLKTSSRLAIKLIARYGDQAEEIAYCSPISPGAKEKLLGAIKEHRVRLANLRGY